MRFATTLLLAGLPLTFGNPIEQVVETSDEYFTIDAKTGAKRSIDQALVQDFKYYSEYAAAAYCPNQLEKSGAKVTCGSYGTCPLVEKSNTDVLHTWYYKGSNGATGFVAADHTRRQIILSMRGSVNMANWVADAKYFQVECPEMGHRKARCNTGFYGFWKESKENGALDAVIRGKSANPSYAIVATGHSLGAAAAVFAAQDLRKKYNDVYLYTYGQPRAGNVELSSAVSNSGVGKTFRITHTSDIVPQLPWESIGNSVCIGNCEPYVHISPEYWISTGLGNKAEQFKVLQGYSNYEGNAASGFSVNIIAHIQYFQPNMYGCVIPGDALVSMVGWGKNDKKRFPDNMEREWTFDDFRAAGYSNYSLQQLELPPRAIIRGRYNNITFIEDTP